MLPVVNIYGFNIAAYGFFILLGVIIGTAVAVYYAKTHYINSEDIVFAMIYGMIGVIAGGKILYLAVELKWIMKNFSQMIRQPDLILDLLKGGFVFYGSLLGAIIMIYLYCRKYKAPIEHISLAVIPSIPLIHAFGRIGCFCAGCCYGTEYSGLGHVVFSNSPIAPNGVSLFPVQLLESALNLIIFTVLVLYRRKINSFKRLAFVYILFYSITRFFTEFLRGDADRGFLWIFSTSQWISIIILTAFFIYKSYKAYYSPHYLVK